jgi:hypothetical protein
MGLYIVDWYFNSSLLGSDSRIHNHPIWHLPEAHCYEFGESHIRTCQPSAQPDTEEGKNNPKENQSKD